MKDLIYQIFVGKDLEELYTFDQPVIEKNQVKCKNLIKKGLVSRTVYTKTIEIFYKEESEEKIEEVVFSLDDGFSIKCLDSKELTWLNRDKEESIRKVESTSLTLYDEFMPTLLEQLDFLKEEVSNLKNLRKSQSSINNNGVKKTGLNLVE